MRYASSIYLGGQLIDVTEATYNDYKNLGIICPFCRESLYRRRGYLRDGIFVSASWCHYEISLNSKTCELRNLTREGKEKLEKLQPKAKGQRLALFNDRFWDIYKWDKDISEKFTTFLNHEKTEQIAKHCWERWDVKEIWANLDKRIKFATDKEVLEKSLALHFSDLSEQEKNHMLNIFDIDFDIVRIKILHEAIAWLATPTAKRAFKKMICLAILDTVEVSNPPYRTNTIANMALNGLILTDWEKAIEHVLNNPKKKKGFG